MLNVLRVGSGRVTCGRGVAADIGREVRLSGSSRAFIIGGPRALSVSLSHIRPALEKEEIKCAVHEFTGYCSRRQISAIVQEAREFGAEIIIGTGGGRSIDTSKAVAASIARPVITIPTSAATCAAWAPLSIVYTDDGKPDGSIQHLQEQSALILDFELIATCPARLMAAGIADAVAKYPELRNGFVGPSAEKTDPFLTSAIELSRAVSDMLFRIGIQAYRDSQEGALSTAMEEAAIANICLTGVVSGLSCGSKQLAFAHTLHDVLHQHFHDSIHGLYHGEIVSLGILTQMILNDSAEKDINKMAQFLRPLHLPTSLADIGLDLTEENAETILGSMEHFGNVTYDNGARRRIVDALKQTIAWEVKA